jgi:tetratricopeptide (TPR) repeat protein
MFRLKIRITIFTVILIALSVFTHDIYAQTKPAEEDNLRKGVRYGWQGKNDEALVEFNKALELNPKSADTYYNRGVIYSKKGMLDEAISDYSKAIESNPDYPNSYYNRGFAYYKKGSFDQAFADFGKAIELNPEDADAYYGRGLCYYKKGKNDDAIAEYNKAIQISPNFALAYDARAVAYFAKKNYAKTLADVNKAASIGFRARSFKPVPVTQNNIQKTEAATQPTEKKNDAVKKSAPVEPISECPKIAIISIAAILVMILLAIFLLQKTKK